jgi:hypothetical protein
MGIVLKELVKGAIGGAISVWMMDRVTWYMYRNEDPEAYQKEKETQIEGKYVAHVAAGKLVKGLGLDLSARQEHNLGLGIHYFLGVAPGALYGVYRHRIRGLDAGRGLLYGLGLFIVMDEIVAPLAGLASGPTAYPWQAHARGVAGHLTVGAVTDTVVGVLDEVLPD